MNSTNFSQKANHRVSNSGQESSSVSKMKMNKSETRHNTQVSRQLPGRNTVHNSISPPYKNEKKNRREEEKRVTYENDESDREMTDFIVDDVDNSQEIQSFIRQIFGNREYDESREISFFNSF